MVKMISHNIGGGRALKITVGIAMFTLMLAGSAGAETLTYIKDGNAFSSASGSYATSSHCSGEACRWISGNQVIIGVYDANPSNWGGSVTWTFDLSSINFGKIGKAELEIQWPSYYGKGLHSPDKNGLASIYANSNNIENLTVKSNIQCYPAYDYFAHPCDTYSLKYEIPVNSLSQNTDIRISTGSKTAWDVGTVKIYIYQYIPSLMEGDVNLNWHVTITDAMFIAQYLAGLRSLT
ncbi:MAG TPA: hypothetical protein VIO11_03145, partial [Candidatus Methanoperedens sp.]